MSTTVLTSDSTVEEVRPSVAKIPFAPRLSLITENITERRALFIIVAATVLVYANSLGGNFVGDDPLVIVNNMALRSWRNLLDAFTTHVWQFQEAVGHQNVPSNYYRPIHTIYMTFGYQAFGLWTFGWHMMSVAVHTTVTLLVYRLLRQFGEDWRTAALASLLFGIYPTHVESVAWISGVTDPLLALFYVPALTWYVRFRNGGDRRWLGASLIAYSLATLSKEAGLTLPMLIVTWEIIRRKDNWQTFIRASALRLAPYMAIAFCYLLTRYAVLGKINGVRHTTEQTPQIIALLTVPYIAAKYLQHQFAPYGLSLMYDYSFVTGGTDPRVLIPVALFVGLAVLLWISRRNIGFAVWMSIALMIVPLLLSLHLLVFPTEFIFQDRYFYLSSIGFCYLAARLIKAIARTHKRLTLSLTAAIVIALSASTARENYLWRDELTLWSRAAQYAPQSWRANHVLAIMQLNHGNLDAAHHLLERATQLTDDPRHLAAVYEILVWAHYSSKSYDNAMQAARHAIALNPQSLEAHITLGKLLMYSEKFSTAHEEFRQALALEPKSATARIKFAQAKAAMGDYHGAITYYELALTQLPNEVELLHGLATSYKAIGQQDKATQFIERAKALLD